MTWLWLGDSHIISAWFVHQEVQDMVVQDDDKHRRTTFLPSYKKSETSFQMIENTVIQVKLENPFPTMTCSSTLRTKLTTECLGAELRVVLLLYGTQVWRNMCPRLNVTILDSWGLFWQKVEIIREYVTAICSAVWILEAMASLGTCWLNVHVIASDFSKFKLFKGKCQFQM